MQFCENIGEYIRSLPVILDTDTANEADDQFAVAYAALSEKIDLRAVLASPFSNSWQRDPAAAVRMSFDEAEKYLSLAGRDVPVLMGSDKFLTDTVTPVISEASEWLVSYLRALPAGERAVVCIIGAATNVASALLCAPDISEKMIILWQAGHVPECPEGDEFNLCSDVAAGRVIFSCDVPLILLPAYGAASVMGVSARELCGGIRGRSDVGDALYELFCGYVGVHGEADMDRPKIIWDIASIGVLAGCPASFEEHPRRCRIRDDEFCEGKGSMTVCRNICREAVLRDMYRCLSGELYE